MPKHETEVMRCARTIAALQRRRRTLRRELKKIDADLKVERRHLRALVDALADRRPDVFPLRAFGEGVGVPVHDERKTGSDR